MSRRGVRLKTAPQLYASACAPCHKAAGDPRPARRGGDDSLSLWIWYVRRRPRDLLAKFIHGRVGALRLAHLSSAASGLETRPTVSAVLSDRRREMAADSELEVILFFGLESFLREHYSADNPRL
jgi:hypothetical protein